MLRIIVTAGAFWLAAASAGAQELGDAARGRAFAQQVCARCHGIERGVADSPNAAAPTFPVIAQVPGLTALALTVSLQGAHREMPDLVLDTQETADVIAFILSFQRAN
jgi:mono/diheme cytochrome c family protein